MSNLMSKILDPANQTPAEMLENYGRTLVEADDNTLLEVACDFITYYDFRFALYKYLEARYESDFDDSIRP